MKKKNELNFYIKVRSGKRTELDVRVIEQLNESVMEINGKEFTSSQIESVIVDSIYQELKNGMNFEGVK